MCSFYIYGWELNIIRQGGDINQCIIEHITIKLHFV